MRLSDVRGSARWIFFASRRFSSVERKGRSHVTSALASLGICLGVAVLIVVLAVMNGFQMGFKDAIMEISSYHARLTCAEPESARLVAWCREQPEVRAATPFYEAQGLLVGGMSRQGAAIVRAVPEDVLFDDEGLSRELRMASGVFDVSGQSIVLGSTLARNLSVRVGGEVTILAMSGSSDTSLFGADRTFTVTGIFRSEYGDINAGYSFISLGSGAQAMGQGVPVTVGIKLFDPAADSAFMARVQAEFPGVVVQGWRDYNRTFFGALRVEKNMLMLLVVLIFVVVAVNIYNGMKRMVYERREEIAVMSALGGRAHEILLVFMAKGFIMGFTGAFLGVVLGLFVSVNMRTVFLLLSRLQYFFAYVLLMAVRPQDAPYLFENPMFAIYANIPARIIPGEVLAVFLFGLLSSLAASALAGRDVLGVRVAEVLHDE